MKTTYTPLTELPQSDQIGWRVNPAFEEYVPLDRVGLDVLAVRSIATVAGYYPDVTITTHDRITPYRQQPAEPTEEKPKGFSIHISGINADGTATGSAGMSRRRLPDLSNFATGNTNFGSEGSSQSLFLSQSREPLRIGLDVNHITQAVEAEGQLRDPQVWSRHISRTLRRQMLGATNQAMLTSAIEMGGFSIVYLGLAAADHPEDFVSLRNIEAHGITFAAASAIASYVHVKNRNPDRHTGWIPFRPDRWAIAQMRARTTRFAKALPASS